MTADELLALIASQPGAVVAVEHSHIHREIRRGIQRNRIVGCRGYPCQREDGHVRRTRVDLPEHGSNSGALYYSAWEPDTEEQQ